jgi:hypothetical protein
MGPVVNFLVSTSGVVSALIVAASWLWRRPQSRAARRFLVTVAAGYALVSIYAMPALMNRGLSAGYHKFTAAEAP